MSYKNGPQTKRPHPKHSIVHSFSSQTLSFIFWTLTNPSIELACKQVKRCDPFLCPAFSTHRDDILASSKGIQDPQLNMTVERQFLAIVAPMFSPRPTLTEAMAGRCLVATHTVINNHEVVCFTPEPQPT